MATIRGGDKLEGALKRIAKQLEKKAKLRVGFLEGANYPDGTPVALVAATQDFGSADIPPRPFFRNMVAAKSGEWPEAIAKSLVRNDYDVERTLEQVGEGIEGQLRQSVLDTNAPALSPKTIKRKGFSKPLVDTGTLLNSVDFEVKGE